MNYTVLQKKHVITFLMIYIEVELSVHMNWMMSCSAVVWSQSYLPSLTDKQRYHLQYIVIVLL